MRCYDARWAEDIVKGLTKAANMEGMVFKGGEARRRECGPMSYQGYFGIEKPEDQYFRISTF